MKTSKQILEENDNLGFSTAETAMMSLATDPNWRRNFDLRDIPVAYMARIIEDRQAIIELNTDWITIKQITIIMTQQGETP